MTFYAKLHTDGSLYLYPYTLTDLRRDNPNTSFPKMIDSITAASFGAVPVRPTDLPPDDHTVNFERTAVKQGDVWIEAWAPTPASPEQIVARTNEKATSVRLERDRLLSASDWTQLPDVSHPQKAEWAAYRQELRDTPTQAGFPWDVQWPSKPE